MSDTLVIDGRINTVIPGTVSQRKKLYQLPDQMEYDGALLYGSHISSSPIMSCYVQDYNYGHIHFVDGSGGGDIQASTILKRKLQIAK
jgi:hypothetical protein